MRVLNIVWAQQFREAQGQVVYKELKKDDGHTQIQNPHDPEARYSRQRIFEWLGDKVQVTETEDQDYPHIITDILATDSNRTDYEELPLIQDRLLEHQCQPGEHYVDAGYMSGPNPAHCRDLAIDLIGPVPEVVTPQDLISDGITQNQFQMDLQKKIATCPQGYQARHPGLTRNTWSFHFPQKIYPACPLRARCCTGQDGRTVGMNIHYELVQAACTRQRTDAFKKDYHHQHRR